MSMVMLMTISIAISIRRINNNHNNDNIKIPPTTPAAVVGPQPTTTTTTTTTTNTSSSSSSTTTPNVNTAMMKDIETLYNIRTSVIENYQSRNEILKLGITPAVIYNELITGNWAAWIAEIQQEDIQHEAIQQQREDNDAANDNETWIDSNDGTGSTTTDASNTKGGSIVKGVGFSIADLSNRTIMGLFVRPEYHGEGIGKRLLQIAENWLWEGLERDNQNIVNDIIWLTTSNNPKFRAYGFYQHVGWILDESYIHDSSSENDDEVRYIKKRPPSTTKPSRPKPSPPLN